MLLYAKITGQMQASIERKHLRAANRPATQRRITTWKWLGAQLVI